MLFASRKMTEAVRCRTSLQHDLCALLELDHAVAAFYALPEDVEYPWNETRLWLRPDFRVFGRSSASTDVAPQIVVKICPAADIDTGWPAARIQAVERALSPPGTVLRLVSPEAIRRQPRLGNVRLLLRFRSFVPDPAVVSAITRALVRSDGVRIADISPSARWAEMLASIAALVLQHAVRLDLDAPIGPDTRIFAGEEARP